MNVEKSQIKVPGLLEMIQGILDKYGEDEGLKKLGIDSKTLYNYRKGGNPNKSKLRHIKETYSKLSGNTPENNKEDHQGDLIKLLIEATTERKTQLTGLESRLNAIEENQQEILARLDLFLSGKSESSPAPIGIPEVEVVRKYSDKIGAKGNKNTLRKS